MSISSQSNTGLQARSQAFAHAAMCSEIRRAYAVMAVVLLAATPIAFLDATRAITSGQVKAIGLAAATAIILVQACTIAFTKWHARTGRPYPNWFGVASVVFECSIPTAAIIANILSQALTPYAALSSPSMLGYGLLIVMTTLRLRPHLCVLAGAISALGYASIYAYTTLGLGITEPTTGLPRIAYFVAPLLIFATGAAAAWVAMEVRSHVLAALAEAETRREMDRIQNDLAVASSIQRALLPHGAPEIPNFDIAGWNRPADQTGGDYFDWHPLPDGNWIITLADVSGHGIGPALVTAACRAYVRASSAHHRDLPSLATRINALLAADLPDGRFVTMVCVLIDPRTPNTPLALLSAGHGPIVLRVNATGEVRDLMPQDLPLAIDPDTTFGPTIAVPLQVGDVLALVTDGFVEWARTAEDGSREQFGMTRLRQSLAANAHLPAARIIEEIASDVARFAGTVPQQDDLTMVIIRRT